ncbi:MAG TPA: hypothetical protein ENG87_01725 [Candidatus Pacearchaeota archaeon]|nr:hypothetical protein [Candidatus Pacearchaeota archaeon]
MTTKQIINLIPTIQAMTLANENIKIVKKKKVKAKDLMGLGAKNLIGIELIKIESSLIAGL